MVAFWLVSAAPARGQEKEIQDYASAATEARVARDALELQKKEPPAKDPPQKEQQQRKAKKLEADADVATKREATSYEALRNSTAAADEVVGLALAKITRLSRAPSSPEHKARAIFAIQRGLAKMLGAGVQRRAQLLELLDRRAQAGQSLALTAKDIGDETKDAESARLAFVEYEDLFAGRTPSELKLESSRKAIALVLAIARGSIDPLAEAKLETPIPLADLAKQLTPENVVGGDNQRAMLAEMLESIHAGIHRFDADGAKKNLELIGGIDVAGVVTVDVSFTRPPLVPGAPFGVMPERMSLSGTWSSDDGLVSMLAPPILGVDTPLAVAGTIKRGSKTEPFVGWSYRPIAGHIESDGLRLALTDDGEMLRGLRAGKPWQLRRASSSPSDQQQEQDKERECEPEKKKRPSADVKLGPSFELEAGGSAQLSIGATGALPVTPNGLGSITAGVHALTASGDFWTVMIPVGFEYDFKTPIQDLSIVMRTSAGFALRHAPTFISPGLPEGTGPGTTTGTLLVLPEAGAVYRLGGRAHIGLDLLTVPLFIDLEARPTATFRSVAYGGIDF